MIDAIKIFPAGDAALMIKLGDDISIQTNARVRSLYFKLKQSQLPEIIEMVPAYNDLLVYYHPMLTDFYDLKNKIAQISLQPENAKPPAKREWQLPVYYGGESGPDLQKTATTNNTSTQKIIEIHTSKAYPVYMLGFSPGFCYLGDVDLQISCPRLETPRLKVAAGSVGIAGTQTGIYPIESPGGWNIIGICPVKLFNPQVEPAIFIQPGDFVRFVAITHEGFQEIKAMVEAGNYKVPNRLLE